MARLPDRHAGRGLACLQHPVSGILGFFKTLALFLGFIQRQQQKQAGIDAQRAAEAEDALDATQAAQDIDRDVRARPDRDLVGRL